VVISQLVTRARLSCCSWGDDDAAFVAPQAIMFVERAPIALGLYDDHFKLDRM
jgi:hypothetical protein